jgi:hypothetical protein
MPPFRHWGDGKFAVRQSLPIGEHFWVRTACGSSGLGFALRGSNGFAMPVNP